MVRALCLCAVAVSLAATGSIALARPTNPNPTALGSSTNALAPYNLAAGFHRIATNLRPHGKPEVLLLGTLLDYSTASVRWPLIKSLAQFGTWSGVKPAAQSCPSVPDPRPANQVSRAPGPHGREPCGPPTFDLAHGTYHSRYLSFSEKDLLDQADHVSLNHLSRVERSLYTRYARTQFYPSESDNIWGSVTGQGGSFNQPTRRLPLFLVGNQLQVGVMNTVEGDFALSFAPGSVIRPSWSLVPFVSFDTVRTGLLHNAMPKPNAGFTYASSLLFDVNTDSNIFTAVICHVDGMQPRKVCDYPIIKAILKHVK